MTTPTKDLALVENPAPEPLTKTQAKALDKKVRSTADRVIANHTKTLDLLDNLKELLTQARDGEIHKALGLKSWTAYLADAVNISLPQREDRKELVQFLSDEGASQRAISKMIGVSQKTVDRDLEGHDGPDKVTSLDGAERPAKGKAKAEEPEQDYIDAEVVEEAEEADDEDVAMKAVDIVTVFNEETSNLFAAANELSLLTAEEKWPGARNRVIKANLNNLGDIIIILEKVRDELMDGS